MKAGPRIAVAVMGVLLALLVIPPLWFLRSEEHHV
mgnify:CR=1 FL=1